MKRPALFLVMIVFYCLPVMAQEVQPPEDRTSLKYPRLGVYRTNPSPITPALRDRLARFDLVVLDYDVEGEELVKEANPDCILIAYCNPMELFDPAYQEGNQGAFGFAQLYSYRPLQADLYRFVSRQREEWWLDTVNGQKINYWLQPPMRMLNLSDQCSEVDGQQWSDFIAQYIIDNILSNPVWDGVFIDNCWENISWISEYLEIQIDINNNGLADETFDQIDNAWRRGVENLVSLIRQASGPDYILIGNKPCLEHAQFLNGKMWEDFPPPCHNRDWDATMAFYFELSSRPGFDFSLIQTRGNDQSIRFGLTSALLANGIYVFGQDKTRWFADIYEIDLGQPIGPAISPHQPIDLCLQVDPEIVIENSVFVLSPVQGGIQTRILEEGSYIVSYQYALEDRQKTILMVKTVDTENRTIKGKTIERWPVSWGFDYWELREPSSIAWRAVDIGNDDNLSPSKVILKTIEVVRICEGVWMRPFDNGWVFCNPSSQPQPVFPFMSNYTLPPRDGLIWLKEGRMIGNLHKGGGEVGSDFPEACQSQLELAQEENGSDEAVQDDQVPGRRQLTPEERLDRLQRQTEEILRRL